MWLCWEPGFDGALSIVKIVRKALPGRPEGDVDESCIPLGDYLARVIPAIPSARRLLMTAMFGFP